MDDSFKIKEAIRNIETENFVANLHLQKTKLPKMEHRSPASSYNAPCPASPNGGRGVEAAWPVCECKPLIMPIYRVFV